jgi:phosphatidylglycerol lysyltransferase
MVHNLEPEDEFPPPLDFSPAGRARSVPPAAALALRAGWSRGRFFIRVLVPLGVLALVGRELARVDWHQAVLEMRGARPAPIVGAAILTLVCVAVMGLYDVLALGQGSRFTARERWRLGSAICSWTNFLAVGPLAGPALRLYFYRRAGMGASGVLRGLAGIYAGMFAGIVAWIGAVFAPLPERADTSAVRVSIGVCAGPLVCVAIGALIARLRRTWAAETSRTYVALGLVGAAEWGLVVGVFVLVGRAIGITTEFIPLARAFFVGHVAGVASLVPGGIGSADTVWLKMNVAQGTAPATAAAQVLLFRCVYFLWPWGVSIAALGIACLRRSARIDSGGNASD